MIFSLVLVFKDIEPNHERTRITGLFLTVGVVSVTTCMLSINLWKHLFIKFSW